MDGLDIEGWTAFMFQTTIAGRAVGTVAVKTCTPLSVTIRNPEELFSQAQSSLREALL